MTNDDGRKPEGAPERSAKAGAGAPSGVDGNGPKRFSVQRKMAIVGRLLRGEPLELVARETNVSIARLSEWRERALAGAATALKERERDDRDDEIARLKSKVGEITMDNELLYAKIAAFDFQVPWLKNTLGFLGMTDVEVIRIEGTAFGPEAADKALERAATHARDFVGALAAA